MLCEQIITALNTAYAEDCVLQFRFINAIAEL